MTQTEKMAWGSLVASILIYAWFFMRMTDDFAIVQYQGDALIGVLIALIIATVIVNIIIASIASVVNRKQGDKAEIFKDERDLAIEQRATRNGYYAMASVVNVVIIIILVQDTSPEYRLGVDPWPLRIESTSDFFFILMSALFLADFVKQGSTILSYRRQGV